MNDELQETDLKLGEILIEKDIKDVERFMGVQAERIEIVESRISKGRAIPDWSNDEAFDAAFSGQRGLEDMQQYLEKGRDFAAKYIAMAEVTIHHQLCSGNELKPEVKELEKDSRELLKEIAKLMIPVMISNLPTGLLGAVGSLAASVAVIFIKNKLESFCEINLPGESDGIE